MDHQPLNTGEQKDMTEFFTDLITKLEEMGPDMVCVCDDYYNYLIIILRFNNYYLIKLLLFIDLHLLNPDNIKRLSTYQKSMVKSLFGGVLTNNVVSLVSNEHTCNLAL